MHGYTAFSNEKHTKDKKKIYNEGNLKNAIYRGVQC